MNQRGRKSAGGLAVVHGLSHRPDPPEILTDRERVVWMATVNSRPVDWFGSEHLPTLVDYCRNVARADYLDEAIKALDPTVELFHKLTTLAHRTSGVINALARSMRLTHQSQYRADKVLKSSRAVKPWQDAEAEG